MPMKTLAALVGIAFLLAAGSARPAFAQDRTSAVAVENCGFNTWTLLPNALSGSVEIRFKAAVPTDVVDFQLLWGDGKLTQLHDVGHFSPGVPITHVLDFQLLGLVSGETLQTLHVMVVHTHTESGRSYESPLSGGPDYTCHIYRGGGAGY
jgi:hypothetical protein